MKMKKYLMTGIAALALCVGFTSCSHDLETLSQEEIDQLQAQKVIDNYKKAFEAYVGGPVAANQDWGFGSSAYAARTRSNPGETYPATHVYKNGEVVTGGVNANANEWADPNKEFGGWVVPDPLTDDQKALVKAYFQSKPDISYEDPHLRHFFVQQVYKGNPETAGQYSTEKVIAADGSEYTSNNMNHLTVGQNNMHINNFNGGTCSTNNEVLKNGSTVNNPQYQSDEIMLMVNIDDTSCFGYHDSGSSNQSDASPNHNDKAALVSWQTIRTWAIQQGIYDEDEDILNDGWDRSFMGFDLAIKEGEQAYAKDANGNVLYATYDQAPEAPEYAWDGENVIRITTGEYEEKLVGNEWSTWTARVPVYKDEYKTILDCGWLTTNENFYIAADKVTLDQSYQVNGGPSDLNGIKNAVILKEFTVKGTKYQSVINLPRIKQLIDDDYLPVKDKSLQDWVKVGVSDGVFSDWIVTLTEAQRQTPPTPPSNANLRVMAEDLTLGSLDEDFDFNDIVFDVYYGAAGAAKVKIKAAGGTLKLRITAGKENPSNDTAEDWYEVHDLFSAVNGENLTGIMINTHGTDADQSGAVRRSSRDGMIEPDFITLDFAVNEPADAKKIKIQVLKGTAWTDIEADQGQPAAKIAVPIEVNWCKERVSIKHEYETFADWATRDTSIQWWLK